MIERNDLELLQGPFTEVLEQDLSQRTRAFLRRIKTDEKLEWDHNTDPESEFEVLSKVISTAVETPFIKSFVNESPTGKRYVVAPDFGSRNYVLEVSNGKLSITPKSKHRTLSDLID